ncbi:MAG: ribose-5-phosphate isomerase RpiA [Thermoplasmata archaeon]
MPEPILVGKRAAAIAAAARVPRGTVLALGTGSTAELSLDAIAKRFPDGGGLSCVASSGATEARARALGLPLRPLEEVDGFDLMIDGADEATIRLELTKGHGGALLREKLLARLSREVIIAVDESKMVDRLGARRSIPVEIVPFARPALLRALERRGLGPELRRTPSGAPELTDNGNELVDLVGAGPIEDPAGLDRELKGWTGVVETGIFVGIAHRLLLGRPDGSVEELASPAAPGKP